MSPFLAASPILSITLNTPLPRLFDEEYLLTKVPSFCSEYSRMCLCCVSCARQIVRPFVVA